MLHQLNNAIFILEQAVPKQNPRNKRDIGKGLNAQGNYNPIQHHFSQKEKLYNEH